MSRSGGLIVALLLLAGCAPKAIIAENFAAEQPTCIAVLPVQNNSVEEEGPDIFRNQLEAKLAAKGYRVPSREQVDEILVQYDIDPTQGGQVMALVPTDFAKDIDCDGLMYATIMEMGKKTLWTYNSVTVTGAFMLVNGRDGAELWRLDDSTAVRQVITDPRDIEASATATAAILLQGYEPLVEEAVDRALAQLPSR